MFKLLRHLARFLFKLVWALIFRDRAKEKTKSTSDGEPPSAESERDGHEVSDARPKVIAMFVVGLFVMIFGVMAALAWMYVNLYAKREAIPVPQFQATFKHAPVFKTSIEKDWDAIDAAARQRLNGYGWTDRANGVARIPLARALELVAKEGLPARPNQPTPPFPPPEQEKLPLMELEPTQHATNVNPNKS